jgi:hypothetical protein
MLIRRLKRCICTFLLIEQSKTTNSHQSKLKSLNGKTKVWRRQPKDKTCVNSLWMKTSVKIKMNVKVFTIYNSIWSHTTIKTKKGKAKNEQKTEKTLKLTLSNQTSFGIKLQQASSRVLKKILTDSCSVAEVAATTSMTWEWTLTHLNSIVNRIRITEKRFDCKRNPSLNRWM